jgi:hypothetical protein
MPPRRKFLARTRTWLKPILPRRGYRRTHVSVILCKPLSVSFAERDSGERIRAQIAQITPSLHGAGPLSAKAFDALFRHASRRPIDYSAETGAGATTLLLSHMSRNHTVFAVDSADGSVRSVKRSPLLNGSTVTFVEGPTQQTLPRHEFHHKLQAVIIDGPHAYPFPDLEYYFFYPHLDTGALLMLDDIHIRSIHNLFEFLRADPMFRLDEVVGRTAFFTRTEAPTFNPLGDSWWEQNYNCKPLLRFTWRARLKRRVPSSIRRALVGKIGVGSMGLGRVKILAPASHETVGAAGAAEGTALLPPGCHFWVLAHRKDVEGWWPQGGGPIAVCNGRWRAHVRYGEPRDAGHEFEIAALIVGEPTHNLWKEANPPVGLPPPKFIHAEAYRTVQKTAS